MSATEFCKGDPISARIIGQVSINGHTLRILFKKNFDREETLLAVIKTVNHKLPALAQEKFEKIAPVVTVLSPSKSSQEIQSNNLDKYTFGSFVDDKSSEISLIISFKGAPRLTNNMIFRQFIHVISSNNGVFLKTTPPKEVLSIVITLFTTLELETFDFMSTLVDDAKQLMNTLGDDIIPMVPSLLLPLIRICEHGQSEETCGYEDTASQRGAGKLIIYLLDEHSCSTSPYLIHLETMVGMMLKNDSSPIMFSELYPKVLEALKDRHGMKAARSLWNVFLDHLKIDAVYWKEIYLEHVQDFMDTLKFTVQCIGNEGITTSEQEEINTIISIALNARKTRPKDKANVDKNDNVLKKLASLIQETIKTFGQPFISVLLPALPLLISMIYSFKWRSEFIPYLMENALGNTREGQEMKAALSCFRFSARNTIEFIRPHLIVLVSCCEKNLTHSNKEIRSESMELLKRILSKRWIKEVMENLGVERITTLCDNLLKAIETEEENADNLNAIIADVADCRMEANLKWFDLVLFVEEASTSNNNNLKKTAIMVLRCVPSLVIGEGETIANTIKDILLTCIQNEHYEEALNTFSVLANKGSTKESEAKNDEWLMRSLSEMIPVLLTMAYCALETGEFDISKIETSFDVLLEMVRRSIMNPYLPSILSLCKTALDTARYGQSGQVSKQLGVLAVTATRHIFTKMGSMMATAVTEPWCVLGSHSIVVGNLVSDEMERRIINYASRSFKRLDPPKLSFECVYSLFASIDKMKPTEGSCLLLFLHSHGCINYDGIILIEPAKGKHDCKGYMGMYCNTTENDGEAWPIYLTDVIYHMSQRLKQLDKEEKRGVESVAIISPMICLVEQEVLLEKKKYNFNKHSTDNVCLILNSDNGKKLTVNARKDLTRLVSLEILAGHKTIREGLDALKNVKNGNHGKFRVYVDRAWVHSRSGEEFLPDNDDTKNFHNFLMGKGTVEDNIYLSTLFGTDLNTDTTQDSHSSYSDTSLQSDDNSHLDSHSSYSDTSLQSDDNSHMSNDLEDDPSNLISLLEEKLKHDDPRIRLNALKKINFCSDSSHFSNLLPTLIEIVESALKRCEDVMEIYYAFRIFSKLIFNPIYNQYLPVLLNLSHNVLESAWIRQEQEGSSISTKAANVARQVRAKMNSMASNDLSAHPADKSAFVPLSLSSNDVLSEDIEIDLFNQTPSPFQADKSAFVISSCVEVDSAEDAVDNRIFGEIRDGSNAPTLA